MMKKMDLLVPGAAGGIALVLWLVFRLGQAPGAEAVITRDGEEYGRYSLTEEQTIELEGNRLVIENGAVHMEWADCPDQVCVEKGKISRTGEAIICLPHKLTVTVEGGGENTLDGISG